MPLLTPGQALRDNLRRDGVGKIFAPAGESELTTLGTRTDGAQFPDYPARIFAQDQERDTAKFLKARQAGIPVNEPGYMGHVMFNDDDARWQIEKMEMQEAARFEKFIIDNHPRTTYADIQQFNRIRPEWLKERVDVFKEKMDFLTRLGIIKMSGIWSIEDWEVLYGAICGKYWVPPGFSTLLKGPALDDKYAKTDDDIIGGIFSFRRYTDLDKEKLKFNIAKDNVRELANIGVPGFDVHQTFDAYWKGEDTSAGKLWQTRIPTFPASKELVNTLPSDFKGMKHGKGSAGENNGFLYKAPPKGS